MLKPLLLLLLLLLSPLSSSSSAVFSFFDPKNRKKKEKNAERCKKTDLVALIEARRKLDDRFRKRDALGLRTFSSSAAEAASFKAAESLARDSGPDSRSISDERFEWRNCPGGGRAGIEAVDGEDTPVGM